MTTTFVDPLGIVASGKTGIVQLSPSNSPVIDIPHDCGWMVAVMTQTSNNAEVTLPSGANVGDIVEIYVLHTAFTGFTVLAPSGETINGTTAAEISTGVGRLFRKVTSTNWVTLGPSDGNP